MKEGQSRGGTAEESQGRGRRTVRCFSRGLREVRERPRPDKPSAHKHLLVCCVHPNNMFIIITNPLILLFSLKLTCALMGTCVFVFRLAAPPPFLSLPCTEKYLLYGREGGVTYISYSLFHQQTPSPCPFFALCVYFYLRKPPLCRPLSLPCRWSTRPLLVHKLPKKKFISFFIRANKRNMIKN